MSESDESSVPIAPLRRDFCCRKNMLWATSIHQEIPVANFAMAMEQHGFTVAAGASPIAGLHIFDHHGTGHRVIHVARSGRIQIRLDPMTGHDDRPDTAAELYELLVAASHDAATVNNADVANNPR